MPCSEYKGKQRSLCFATKQWTDFSKVDMFKKEKLEHPSFNDKQIAQIVKDHIKLRK